MTDNGTSGLAVGTQLFMKENRYQIHGVFANGNLNYTLFGEGFFGADPGAKLPISQTGRVFFGEAMRNVEHKIFIGQRLWVGTSTVTIRKNSENVVNLPDIGLHTDLVSLGVVATRDTRPNRFYPLTGSLIDFSSDFFAQVLGSKYTFQAYRFTFNKYGSLSERQVLAYNLFLHGTGGQPPFYGNCIYGIKQRVAWLSGQPLSGRFYGGHATGVPADAAETIRSGWIWWLTRRST